MLTLQSTPTNLFYLPKFAARQNSFLPNTQVSRSNTDKFMHSSSRNIKFGWVVTPRTAIDPLDSFIYPELPTSRSPKILNTSGTMAPPLQEWYQPLLLLLLQAPKSNTSKQVRTEWLQQLNIIAINLIIALNSDLLTGLWNRAFFDKQLSAQVDQAKSKRESICLATIDLNDFKAINESCGHPFGDQAIQTFANILKENTPKGSSVCRIGGDEFAIIFPNNTNIENAEKALQPIKQALQDTPVKEGNLIIHLSGSFGLAEIKTPTSAFSAYKTADSILAQAKNLKIDDQIRQALQAKRFGEVKQLMSKPRNSHFATDSF